MFFSIASARWCLLVIIPLMTLLHQRSFGSSSLYTTSLETGTDGKPVLTITNAFQHSITAFAVTTDVSSAERLGEYRSYYDVFVSYGHDWPIGRGDSVTLPVAHVVGSADGIVAPKIRAVVFSDGTTVGEQAWITVLLTRRNRLRSILSNIHEMIAANTNLQGSVRELVTNIKSLKLQVDSSFPDDEFRAIDDVMLAAALSTVNRNNTGTMANADTVHPLLASYDQVLQGWIAGLEESKPASSAVDFVVPSPFEGTARRRIGTFSSLLQIDMPHGLILPLTSTCGIQQWTEHVVLQLTQCGPSQKWDLSIALTDYNSVTGKRTNTTYDAGNYNANGACWNNYTDCNGSSHAGGADPGNVHHFSSNNGTTTRFYWTTDNWSAPGSSACDPCTSIDPNGIIFSAPVNSPAVVGFFYFQDTATTCTVT